MEFSVVLVVQEVNVDAVGVVGGTNWSDGGDGGGSLAPRSARHASRVVDQEYGIEGREEAVGIVRWGCGVGGRWGVGWWWVRWSIIRTPSGWRWVREWICGGF